MLIAEVEVEFLYGKKPVKQIYTDSKGNKSELIVFTNGKDDIVNPDYHDNYVKGYRPKPDMTKDSPYCCGVLANGHDLDKCIALFDVFIAFGEYGFNLSH